MVKQVSVKAHTRSYPEKTVKASKVEFSGRDVLTICKILEKKYPDGIPINVLKTKTAKAKNVSGSKVETAILVLKRDGMLFSPSKGKVKFVR